MLRHRTPHWCCSCSVHIILPQNHNLSHPGQPPSEAQTLSKSIDQSLLLSPSHSCFFAPSQTPLNDQFASNFVSRLGFPYQFQLHFNLLQEIGVSQPSPFANTNLPSIFEGLKTSPVQKEVVKEEGNMGIFFVRFNLKGIVWILWCRIFPFYFLVSYCTKFFSLKPLCQSLKEEKFKLLFFKNQRSLIIIIF